MLMDSTMMAVKQQKWLYFAGAIAQLRDENNLVGRIGFIATGGLLGLIAARRGRFLKKATYLSLGLAGMKSHIAEVTSECIKT